MPRPLDYTVNRKRSRVACAALALIVVCQAPLAADWQPLEVEVWNPPFNAERKREARTYEALKSASERWRICASIPHLKDAYWAAVNFALVDEAKRLGVALRINEAGGYDHLDVQREQIEQCMGSGGDGLVVSAITLDGVDDLIARYAAAGKPAIDLINGASSNAIAARAAADFWDNGHEAGLYLAALQAGGDGPLRVAWFPGPQGAGWSAAGDAGLRAAAAVVGFELVATRWGDTGRAAQAKLVEAVLDTDSAIDVIVGTAVTAEAAVDVLRARGLTDSVKVMAYYYGPGVHRGIRRGRIIAAPTDQQAIQARIAMDLLVRVLEKKPHPRHVAPKVTVVDRDNVRSFDTTTSLPPRGFRPIFSVNDWE